MTKQEIISLAESMGFQLEYDKFYDSLHPADRYPYPAHMVFIHKDGAEGKKAIKWVWYKSEENESNIATGQAILNFMKHENRN